MTSPSGPRDRKPPSKGRPPGKGGPPSKGGAASKGRPPGKGGPPSKGRPAGKGGPPSKGRPAGKGGPPSKGRPAGKSGPASRPKDGARPARSTEPRPDRPRAPRIPDDITGKEIDRRVAAELRTLPEELGLTVARLLVAVSRALDADDVDLALAYANEAKRLAGRVSVVREALGIAAYSAGDFATALAELRAVRRMTGDQDYVPVMADCERGLGRPRKALELLDSVAEGDLSDASRVEARIVAAGARRDLGQPEAALLLLQVPALSSRRTEEWLPRLRYAYADTLLELGRGDEARTWFERAAQADPEGITDAEERLAEMDGIVFDEAWGEDEEDQRPTDAASPDVEPGPSA